jgi:hypothetical protein
VIENFDAVKKQIDALAETINSFKSEAVQLRLLDIIFGIEQTGGQEETADETEPEKRRRARKPPKPNAKATKDATPSASRATSGSRFGATAALNRMLTDGFFANPKTLAEMVEHSKNKYAKNFPQSDFSGKLPGLVRDGKLTREKNKDDQYAYKAGK